MRQGEVRINGKRAGLIREDEAGFSFTYDEKYLRAAAASASVSLTLPLREEPYHSPTILPFFDGLIPEGWLLDISAKNWKLDRRDRMGLLLTVCEETIGCVSVHQIEADVSPEVQK